MTVFIEAVGCVGHFGTGLADLQKALKKTSTFNEQVSYEPLYDYVSKRNLRRVDNYSKMALLAGHLALEEAGISKEDLSSYGLIVATGYGAGKSTYRFLDSVIDGGDGLASPMHFSNSVDNSAVAYLSINLGVTGPCLTVSQTQHPVSTSLAMAYQWLQEGRVDKLLFGVVDEHSEVRRFSWKKRYGESCIALGEGAAFFVLSKEASEHSLALDFEGFTAFDLDDMIEQNKNISIVSAGDKPFSEEDQQKIKESGLRQYTSIYGITPTAMGFDLALAVLLLRQEKGVVSCCDFDFTGRGIQFYLSTV